MKRTGVNVWPFIIVIIIIIIIITPLYPTYKKKKG
jgi:hypothetical protein